MKKQYPFYIKSTVILFGLVLLSYSLLNLRDILAPIAFSLIIAILLNPIVNKLQKKKVGKVVSVTIALTFALICIAGLLYFFSAQFMKFGKNLPQLKATFNAHFLQVQNWIAAKFNMPVANQQKSIHDALHSSQALLGKTLGGALGIIGFFVLIPIYVFLLLFYKTLIINFLHETFAEENTSQVSEILSETKAAIQSYMVGLLLEALVVAVLNSVALLIIGVPYAILLGVLGALLNMLPYIGGIVAILLPVLMAAVTLDGLTAPVAIVVAYSVIQFIDNNFLVPFLVSSRVKINAFFSIVVVLLGGALWGVSGMFLSIPFVAIIKIVFDRVPETKPWGKLLGSDIPTFHKGAVWARRLQRKKSVSEKVVEKSQQ